VSEATKTNAVRGVAFLERYCSGRTLDVGAGSDPVVPHAECFDRAHGDAERVLDYLTPESYDCVHSSHCLEHMRDPRAALRDWWALVKPGGVLVVVVPHEDLYEQGAWPSFFNSDHKATFRLGPPARPWSPVSHDLEAMARDLSDGEILAAEVQDHGYDYRWMGHGLRPSSRRYARRLWYLRILLHRFMSRFGAVPPPVTRIVDWIFFKAGMPLDQTLHGALAQIQVVMRKRELAAP